MTSPDLSPNIPPSLQVVLDRLRQLNTQIIQATWQQHKGDVEINHFTPEQAAAWPVAALNQREHIAWDKGLNVIWLHQTITVPTNLNGYPLFGLTLRLALTWWAEDAQIYIDGALVQSGDLFECFTRICLSQSITPGDVFQVAIRLVSPGHDDGALVRSQLIYELPTHAPTPEPSFVADELSVLVTLEPSTLDHVSEAIKHLDWNSLQAIEKEQPNSKSDALNLWNDLSAQSLPAAATIHPFQQSLSQLRRTLLPFSKQLKRHKIQCIGHAHLDMAWLWPVEDTWRAAERTFKSILKLQQDFPELTYTHSSPALFEWIENNRPELFQQIQQKVSEGSWSIDAGLWIEPEFNIVSGEAIARHILYGQKYCQEKFGKISKIAWLPDSFGFCWQLPQLLKLGGIETFATLKLSWNDTTEFPHQLFWWEAPDGSQILSLMLPPIGTDVEPVKIADYAKKWETSTGKLNTLWLPGMGDHGGGPTQDMLEKARRLAKSPFFPSLSFTTPNDYIKQITKDSSSKEALSSTIKNLSTSKEQLSSDALPIWKDELYLELHRGCYTSHADQKQQNRASEDLLYQAEVVATIAQIVAEKTYPKDNLDAAWKTLLFNQFHDILPGTSIPEVFVTANQGWAEVKQIGEKVIHESLGAIASNIQLPESPHPKAKAIIIFNTLSWPRSTAITLSLPLEADEKNQKWTVHDTQKEIECQIVTTNKDNHDSSRKKDHVTHQILFLATDLPAVGYKMFWLYPDTSSKQSEPNRLSHQPKFNNSEPYILENKFIRASINATTGQIDSLIEKSTQTETFNQPGNQLQTFRDQGEYWDAWNIAADYANQPLPTPTLNSIEWIEVGAIRQKLRTTHHFNNSIIIQDYIVTVDSPTLTIKNAINWQDTHVLLKANFPISLSQENITCEIPFGSITRTTNPQREAERAKWEVPALRWADIGHSTFGVSVLTKGKHGFDAGPNNLRLTLLKSPIWPDPSSDKGWHHFTYGIYPHPSTWQSAQTPHRAREFNIEPLIRNLKSFVPTSLHTADTTHSFLQILNPNIILSAFKPTETDPDTFVLRCYETNGDNKTTLYIENKLGFQNITDATAVNILEIPVATEIYSHLKAHQIQTFQVQQTEKHQAQTKS